MVELFSATVSSGADVSYLESCLSLISVRNFVGHIHHPSFQCARAGVAHQQRVGKQNLESLCCALNSSMHVFTRFLGALDLIRRIGIIMIPPNRAPMLGSRRREATVRSCFSVPNAVSALALGGRFPRGHVVSRSVSCALETDFATSSTGDHPLSVPRARRIFQN